MLHFCLLSLQLIHLVLEFINFVLMLLEDMNIFFHI